MLKNFRVSPCGPRLSGEPEHDPNQSSAPPVIDYNGLRPVKPKKRTHWLKLHSRWFKNYHIHICVKVYFDQVLDFPIKCEFCKTVLRKVRVDRTVQARS